MLTETLPSIRENNLSCAWGTALLRVLDHDSVVLSPTLLTINFKAGQLPPEDPDIRKALDTTLRRLDKKGCGETAATIFPFNAWRWKGEPGCSEFSKWYWKSICRATAPESPAIMAKSLKRTSPE